MAELITLERREDGEDDLLQLLVPDLSPSVCKLFLEYCYCDDVFERRAQGLRPSLLAELHRAGQDYLVPRLSHICAKILGTSRLDDDVGPDDETDDAAAAAADDDAAGRTSLKSDLRGLVGDQSFADVEIVAGDDAAKVARAAAGADSSAADAAAEFRYLPRLVNLL